MNNPPPVQGTVKWFYRPLWVFIAIVAVGPFALPVLLLSPAFRLWQKIAISILVIALTVWVIAMYAYMVGLLMERLKALKAIY